MIQMYPSVFTGTGFESDLDFNWVEWLVHQRIFSLGGLVSLLEVP